jgi:hypothetical protein
MPRHRKQPAPVFPIALVFEGKAHSGSYSVESNVVTVRSEHGSEAACCKGDAPHGIAEHVLRSILTRA